MALSFEWLIDPITPGEFFQDYYERKPLRIVRSDPRRYEALLNVARIDRLLAASEHTLSEMFLVDASREIKPEEYTFEDGASDPRIDLARLLQLYGSGASLSLSRLHEQVPELAALCQAVERKFSGHFQTNIYLSPPNAQGFKTHFDSHDVFVLQVSGTKLWTLYDTPLELPMHGQRFVPERYQAGPQSDVFTLNPGDMLYCPRGLFHDARTTGETSLHITLGLIGKTWADLMIEAVSAACLESVEFRQNLPVGFANAGFQSNQAQDTFRSLIDKFARSARLEPLLDHFADEFVAAQRPDLSGCLTELDRPPPITLDSRLEARPNIVFRLSQDDSGLQIRFGTTKITLPAFTHDAVAHALRGPVFAVRALPGGLDDEGKLVLARRLVKEGLLTRADAGATRH